VLHTVELINGENKLLEIVKVETDPLIDSNVLVKELQAFTIEKLLVLEFKFVIKANGQLKLTDVINVLEFTLVIKAKGELKLTDIKLDAEHIEVDKLDITAFFEVILLVSKNVTDADVKEHVHALIFEVFIVVEF
jgi:hypothetical protein